MMRALILSAYDAGSHARWRRTVVDLFPDIEWHVETLPPRFFRWRYRGNALTWGLGDFPDGDYDLVVATSATNFASLLGLRPELASAHKVVYFHENQFIYPTRDNGGVDGNFALQEILTASCADRVVFNSEFNRSSYLSGAREFLGRLPDGVPRETVDEIESKSLVIPVPIELPIELTVEPASSRPRRAGPLRIVWNHRWEHDKGPELLRDAVAELQTRTRAFELSVVGQRFRDTPPSLVELEKLAARSIRRWGFVEERSDYLELLRDSDVVLSTAHHEFQGLAVLEAMMSGCRALVPDALVYPEYVPAEDRYDVSGESATAIATRLVEWAEEAAAGSFRAPTYDLSRFGRTALTPGYAEAFGVDD